MMSMWMLLQIMMSSMLSMGCQSPQPRPPFPASGFFRLCAALEVHFPSEPCTSFVLFLPILGAIFFPILPEFRAEGLGEEEEHDMIPPFGEIFFDNDSILVFDQVPI